jgi:cytochrome c553
LTNARDLLLTGVQLFVLLVLNPTAAAMDMSERVKPCEACHGNQGRAGPDGYYPRLAGKPAGYLYNQMENFSQGRRRYTMMRRMMEPLSPDYQREMANHFAGLHIPYAPPSAPAANVSSTQMQRGRQLAMEGDASRKLPACNSCHGSQLMGYTSHIPSLLGLPAAYLGAQLSAWKQGERSTVAPDCMADIAKRLTPDDATSVTAWLATQPVPTKLSLAKVTAAPADLRCGSAPDLHKGQP